MTKFILQMPSLIARSYMVDYQKQVHIMEQIVASSVQHCLCYGCLEPYPLFEHDTYCSINFIGGRPNHL